MNRQTHRGNGDDPYASARPQELPPTLDVRAALSGRTRGRLRDIRTEMDRVRADFRNLVDSATVRELRMPTDGTKWTNEQLLFHMLFGYLLVRNLARRW